MEVAFQLTLTLQFSAWEPTARALTAGGVDPPTDHRLKVALHVPGMDRTEHPKKMNGNRNQCVATI